MGLVSCTDQAALLFLSRALVLPSSQRPEAFGIVLLEASRQSTPMITTEIGTATSWVNQHMSTGLVVSPNSPVELEEAMMFMHQSPDEAVKMGLLAKQRFESVFDVTLMAQSYIDLYQSVISDKNLLHNTQVDKPKGKGNLLKGTNKL